MKFKILFVLALISASVSATAQLRINGQLLVDPKAVNIGQLGGMILSGNLPSSGGTFLSLNINNDADEPKNVTLTGTFSYNGQELGKGRTKNKVRLAPRASVRLTNNNFMGGEWAMSGRTENNALVQDLLTKAGGKLPNGTYMLTWTLETDDGGFASFPMSFTVAGSREAFVRLISPGAHAGDKADEVNTKFPVFQWTGSADSYTFNLWEDVNKTGNVAAVISLPPMVSARNLTQPTVRYQEVGGSRELQAGKQYIWSVDANVTGGGKATDAFIFTVGENVR
ncbi:MAG: hypothetical protein SNJ55_13985 [Chloroherpetonaceae bacterium]